MFIKLLTVEFLLPGCSSLKEKRFVLSSLKPRLRQRFNVSVAEIDYHDKWQRCRLAVVTVAAERRMADATCDKVLRFIENDHRVSIAESSQEMC